MMVLLAVLFGILKLLLGVIAILVVVGLATGWVQYYIHVFKFMSGGNKIYENVTTQPARIYASNVYTTVAECRKRLGQWANLAGPDNSDGKMTKGDDLGLFYLNSCAAGGKGIALGCVSIDDHAKGRPWLEKSMAESKGSMGWTKESVTDAIREWIYDKSREAGVGTQSTLAVEGGHSFISVAFHPEPACKLRRETGDLAPFIVKILWNQWLGLGTFSHKDAADFISYQGGRLGLSILPKAIAGTLARVRVCARAHVRTHKRTGLMAGGPAKKYQQYVPATPLTILASPCNQSLCLARPASPPARARCNAFCAGTMARS